jgi:hypothetical protein
MPSPFAPPRYPGVRRFKRRKPPANTPAMTFPWAQTDIRLEAAEQQFEEEYASWGRGTRPEFITWRYLTQEKKLVEGVDFVFQSSAYGGRRIYGGQVVDFWIFSRNMVWQVQGEFFHQLTTSARAKDMINRMQLEKLGETVVFLWVNDLLSRPVYVLDLAWTGREVRHV